MQLTYNDFDFGPFNTHRFDIDPVYDPTGKDLLYQRIHITISAIVNPFATATNKITPDQPLGGIGIEGDRLGFSIDNLKDILSTPRQSLQVTVGNDLVIDCPGDDGGIAFDCDPEGGPFPEIMKFEQIQGDKTSLLVWSVRCTVSPCNKYLLSNRWSASVSIDGEAKSTRTLSGTAIFRKDYLDFENLTADNFRLWLIAPTPFGMRRTAIAVDMPEDGASLNYRVTDEEVGYGIGQVGGITRVEGNVTCGANAAFGGLPQLLMNAFPRAAPAVGRQIWNWGFPALSLLGDLTGGGSNAFLAAAAGWAGIYSAPKANALVKVFGQKGTSKQAMVNMAYNVIQDRFRPLSVANKAAGLGNLPILSAYVTQDVGSDNAPFMELRMEFLAVNLVALKAILDPSKAGLMMNFANVYLDDTVPVPLTFGSPDLESPEYPFSNTTRGTWLGELAIAALKANACTLPAVPTDQGETNDVSQNM